MQWLLLAIVFAANGIIPFITYQKNNSTSNNFLLKKIPPQAFEWKSGLRKSQIVFVAVWLGGLLGVQWVGSALLAIVLLAFLQFGFYEKMEPIPMLLVWEKAPRQFLRFKIGLQTKISTFIYLPLVLVFIAFHPQMWYLAAIELALLYILSVYIILLKYAFYHPQSAGPIQIFVALGFISILFPVFIPVIWGLGVFFYFKSIKNLSHYLHDFNS